MTKHDETRPRPNIRIVPSPTTRADVDRVRDAVMLTPIPNPDLAPGLVDGLELVSREEAVRRCRELRCTVVQLSRRIVPGPIPVGASDGVRSALALASTMDDRSRLELIRKLVAPLGERLLDPEDRDELESIGLDIEQALANR